MRQINAAKRSLYFYGLTSLMRGRSVLKSTNDTSLHFLLGIGRGDVT